MMKKVSSIVNSIGFKLFVTIILSIMLIVPTLGYFSYFQSKSIIKEQVSKVSEQTAIQTAEKIDAVLSKYDNLIKQINKDVAIEEQTLALQNQELSDTEKSDIEVELGKTLGFYARNLDNVVNISLIPTDFSSKIISIKKGTAIDEANTEIINSIINEQGGVKWTQTSFDGLLGNAPNTFGLGKLSTDKRYVIYMDIDIDVLEETLLDLDVTESGRKLIVSPESTIIYEENFDLITTDLSTDWTISNADNRLVNGSEFRSMGESENLLSSGIIPSTGWVLVAAQPADVMLQDTRKIFNVTSYIVILAVIISIAVAILLYYVIARPLHHMEKQMNIAKQGDLTVRLPIKRKDEIGKVSRSFNGMLEQLTELVQQTNHSSTQVLKNAASLSKGSKETAKLAKEVSLAMENIAQGAESIASEAESGNEKSMETTDLLQKVVGDNLELGTSAKEVEEASNSGMDQMKLLTERTEQTEIKLKSMNDRVHALNESTTSIRQILEMLDGVAKQTNILALNASIEAARSGAAGKGFMVIADEIRGLADESKKSIQVVNDITEHIQSEVDETVSVIQEINPYYEQQKMTVNETNELFSTVQMKMNHFIMQLDQITGRITELETTQKVVAATINNVSAFSEESSATTQQVASLSNTQQNVSDDLVHLAEELDLLADSLKKSLAHFKLS
ncbi:methyl-accepting chemotaxis protein [Longirhabdus pacifica]|uniref:methyl-accepting chemotaxis protein n=1 Tax=Longirhabdus pacifica TaxID=2305227 RepID=UPI0013E89FCF|nr:methyl-accepting chemotaxis protein [Longirhabdus pacifica]